MAKPIPLHELPVIERNAAPFPGKERFEEGAVIPVDKPSGWSSFDVVKFVRNRLPVRKVGHAGTLDPLATGLLVLCCGRATRSIGQIQEMEKVYLATVMLGVSTPSHDSATDPDGTAGWEHVTPESIRNVLRDRFLGRQMQVPPLYSALKKDGERLYRLARRGESVHIEAREVEVRKIDLLESELPEVRLRIECGKGFYVRSLARDLGKALGSLAHLAGLRRTRIGHFSVESAWEVEQFEKWSGHVQDHPD